MTGRTVAARGLPHRIRTPSLVAGAALTAAAAVAVRDPHEPGSWGFCPVLALTGFYCPGCGGLRAVHDVLHGDLLAGLRSNLMGLVLCGLLTVLWAAWFVGRWRGRPTAWDRLVPAWAAYAVLALFVVFSVFRNTPWGSWLAPAPLG